MNWKFDVTTVLVYQALIFGAGWTLASMIFGYVLGKDWRENLATCWAIVIALVLFAATR